MICFSYGNSDNLLTNHFTHGFVCLYSIMINLSSQERLHICYKFFARNNLQKAGVRMKLQEMRRVDIEIYSMLCRIKASENSENKQLDYEMSVQRIKLKSYGNVDISEIEKIIEK